MPHGTFIVSNALFENNRAPYGGLIMLTSAIARGNMTNCSFHNNVPFTGVFLVSETFGPTTAFFANNSVFANNFGDQGGAIFYQRFVPLNLFDNVFFNNDAFFYGKTLATPAVELAWVTPLANGINVLSGQRLPQFSATMRDFFGTAIVHRSILIDFVFLNLTITSKENATLGYGAELSKDVTAPLLQGNPAAVFDTAEIIGMPGTYQVMVAPMLNYDRNRFFLTTNVTVAPCARPDVTYYASNLERYPRCVARKSLQEVPLGYVYYVLVNFSVVLGWL
jgi:hypothetical protein